MTTRITTSSYPTRYAAWENQGCLVVLTADERGNVHPAGYKPRLYQSWISSGGTELAVFCEATKNRDIQYQEDGIYLEVVTQTKRLGGVLVKMRVSAPTWSRAHWNQNVKCADLGEALDAAGDLIRRAREWVAERLVRERPLDVAGKRFSVLETIDGLELLEMMRSEPIVVCKGGRIDVLDAPRLGVHEEEIFAAFMGVWNAGSR